MRRRSPRTIRRSPSGDQSIAWTSSNSSGETECSPVPSALATASFVAPSSLRRNAIRVPSRENTGRLSKAGPVVMAVTLDPSAGGGHDVAGLGIGKDAVGGRPVGGWQSRLTQHERADDDRRGEQGDQRDKSEDEPESQRRRAGDHDGIGTHRALLEQRAPARLGPHARVTEMTLSIAADWSPGAANSAISSRSRRSSIGSVVMPVAPGRCQARVPARRQASCAEPRARDGAGTWQSRRGCRGWSPPRSAAGQGGSAGP